MSDDFTGAPPAPETPPVPPVAGGDGSVDDTGKILAVVGYLTGIVALIAILIEPYKNQRFVRHHAIQALGLAVAGIVLSIVAVLPVVGWIVAPIASIAIAVLAIIGAVKAWQGEMWEMPVVYGLVKQYI